MRDYVRRLFGVIVLGWGHRGGAVTAVVPVVCTIVVVDGAHCRRRRWSPVVATARHPTP